MKKTFRAVSRALFVLAGLTLGYCGFVVADEWIYQHQEMILFDRLLSGGPAADPAVPVVSIAPTAGGMIGQIEIPRLALSAMIAEGTSTATLRRAVGHISGMALPGQPGNVGLAGHRDTFFRPLRNIHRDDAITVRTVSGVYRYRVVSAKIVGPADVTVLESDTSEILTLVTCYPFYLVGAAPDRFIVRAERII